MAATHSSTDPLALQAQTLASALRVLNGKLTRRLREQTQLGDLSWTQVAVLGRLDRDGPTTVTILARAEGMRPQSMGANIAALEASGFVHGQPDPADGRQTILSLTAAGLAWLKRGRAAREDWLSHAIETKLTPADQADLGRAITLLERLVGA